MPRDKTESHERIVAAAMREFLSKGYEQASMKAIADEVGMTSAALYRHCKNKQDLFASLVQPALTAIENRTAEHCDVSYEALDADPSRMWDFDGALNDAHLILEVASAEPDAFRLLLFRSAGTPYESYVHDMIERATDEMMTFLSLCRKKGYPAKELNRDEMHMLVSAYTAAMLQPFEHGYSRTDAERALRTISDFFTPGWRAVTGL